MMGFTKYKRECDELFNRIARRVMFEHKKQVGVKLSVDSAYNFDHPDYRPRVGVNHHY